MTRGLWALSGLCAVLAFAAWISGADLQNDWIETRPTATNDRSLSVPVSLHGSTYFVSTSDMSQLQARRLAALAFAAVSVAAFWASRSLKPSTDRDARS